MLKSDKYLNLDTFNPGIYPYVKFMFLIFVLKIGGLMCYVFWKRSQLCVAAESVVLFDLKDKIAPVNQVAIRTNHFLQKLTPIDDMEAFLMAFERIAEREE